MGFVGSIFSDDKGAGFQGTGANLVNPTNQGQIDQSYQNSQTGLQQQQAFLQALQSQNGIANQSQALAQQQALQQDLAAQGGVQNQSNVFNQQQGLANQLQGVASGTGPNPAQAALNQATAQNVANQGALMASQRGASQNVGLLARQAAQQGAGIQQQAAGQSATMQAQQQLAGLNALGQQQQALGQTAAQQIAQQQNQNNAVAGLASQQVGQQQGAISGYQQGANNQQSQLLGAQSNFNNAQAGMQSNINNVNAQIAQGNAQGQRDFAYGIINSAPAGVKALAAAHGGMVPPKQMLAQGGFVSDASPSGPQSSAGQFLSSAPVINAGMPANVGSPVATVAASDPNSAASKAGQSIGGALAGGPPKPPEGAPAFGDSAKAGVTDPGLMGSTSSAQAAPSLGAGGLDPSTIAPLVAQFAPMAALAQGGMAMRQGGPVPGQAKVQGDSYTNDTVDAKLSPGEVVIPRSVMQSKDPVANAAAFVQAVMAKQGMRKGMK